MTKKVLFLTGTRADFGKLKPLIRVLHDEDLFEVDIFATGMHLDRLYGYTVREIEKSGFTSIYKFPNYNSETPMDLTLAKTISGLSNYVAQNPPDLIIVHGDRIEALAGAIVGSLNNILVGHVEGGELSGTVDELIRHAVTKLSHIHFVANRSAKDRLIQMGENGDFVHVVGSPDIDIMVSPELPELGHVLDKYEIPFSDFGILIFHPITTELDLLDIYAQNIVTAVNASQLNFVGIYPNNDSGSRIIRKIFVDGFNASPNVIFFPSIRFEAYLVLLRHSKLILGNSSSGVREAPFLGVPSINIGTRQNRRSSAESILNTGAKTDEITQAINLALKTPRPRPTTEFGDGKSAEHFLHILSSTSIFSTPAQKTFFDLIPT
jgi:UDP-N-acetylglucosamine 2-epimerase (hydrolysing)